MSTSNNVPPSYEPFDLTTYAPYYLNAISNRWTSSSSRIYLRRFGIGVVEWRILAALAARGSASSLDIVNLIGIDPASVSKAIRNLEQRGMVTPIEGRFAGRTKPYRMTQPGADRFVAIREVALEREAQLLGRLDDAERDAFLQMLRKIHGGLSDLSREE